MRAVSETEVVGCITEIVETQYDSNGENPYTTTRQAPLDGMHTTYALERADIVSSDRLHATPYSAMRLISKPMTFSLSRDYSVDMGPGTAVVYRRQDNASGTIPWGYTPNHEKPNLSRDKAIIQALNRLGDVKVNLGILYAERASTVGLLGTYAKRLRSLYDAFRRRDVRAWKRLTGASSKQAAKQIANEYLAIQFGVMPIVNDINGVVELLQEKRGTAKYVRVSGKDKSTSVSTVITVTENPASGGEYMSVENRTAWKSGLKAHLTFAINHDDLYRNLNRLGTLNILSVAIDAVKWSWVLEWFVGLNAWAKSLTADVGCEFITGCVSTLHEVVISERIIGTWVHPAIGSRPSDPVVGGQGTSSTKWMNREVLTGVPFTVPYLKNPLGWFQALATLALAVQGLEDDVNTKRKPKQFRYRPKRNQKPLGLIDYVK